MARSKEFEENVVLEKAMKLFWEQGYEKTSIADLVEHMGIHRRSLYDTFGDKHTLFLKAMDRFHDKLSDQAEHLHAVYVGIRVMTRTSIPTEKLQHIADTSIHLLTK
ncbi:helix-turn-helix domain-containing protein [Paenibacillus illinoisensis]